MSPEELAFACFRGGDEATWQEFIRRFNPLIASVALRVAHQWGQASPQVVDDLIQETYLKFCAERFQILENFKCDHKNSIYGFIKVFTSNLVQDHFKASHAQKRGGLVETTTIDDDIPVRHMARLEPAVATFERTLLIGQVAACLQAVTSGPNAKRDCRIFWLYYQTGLSASAIASLPTIALSTKGVESTLSRLTRQVRERLAPPVQPPEGSNQKGITSEESL